MIISIITVNKNNSEGFLQTAKSICIQTSNNFQWIVIDGGSNDGSKDLILEYIKYIDYWVSEPDSGIYNAMNKGINHASGDYCLFLNSGDLLASCDVIKDIQNKINNYINVDFVVGRILIKHGLKNKLLDLPNKIDGHFLYDNSLPHQSTLIKSSLLKKYYYSEKYKIVSDWVFTIEMLLKKNLSLKYIDTVISVYNLNGLSSKEWMLCAKEREKGFLDVMGNMIAQDYRHFIYGRNSLEKMFFKLEKNYIYNHILLLLVCPLFYLQKGFNVLIFQMKKRVKGIISF